MNNVFLIFAWIPDSTDFYHLELTDDEFEKVKLCHMRFINACEDDVCEKLDWLQEFLGDKDKLEDLDIPFVIDQCDRINIVYTGFYL